MRETLLQPGDPKLAEAPCGLGLALYAQGRATDAEPLLRLGGCELEREGLADPGLVDRGAAGLREI